MYTSRIVTRLIVMLLMSACGGAKSGPQSQAPETSHGAAAPVAHAAHHWTYQGETGATHWAELDSEWTDCGGQHQSPIDIDQTVQAELAHPDSSYHPASIKVLHQPHMADETNNGHTIQINYSQGDELTLGVDTFRLAQYHFHSPSEHTVKGKSYPMEMHLVHKSADHRLAVIGVFIEEGAHNKAFDPVWSHLPATEGAEAHMDSVMVDVDALLPANRQSYRYEGSLTTPPCSEGVKWIVMATPIQLSKEQIEAFQHLIHDNNRPVQPRNGRTVETEQIALSEK